MSSPVTEILILSTNEAFKTNPEAFAAITNIADENTAIQRQAWGDRVDDPSIRAWILDWGSANDTAAVKPELFKTVQERLAPLLTAPPKQISVSLKSSPIKCINAPVTELIFATAKPETDLASFSEICDESLRATDVSDGCYGTSWGFTSQDERSLVMIIGWETIAHHKAFCKTESFEVTTVPFRAAVAQAEVFYVKFQNQ